MKKVLLFLVTCFISILSLGQVGPITGPNTLCQGDMITLSDATPGGVWSSGTTPVATIGSSSGIVNGISPGTTTITYSDFSGSPPALYTITVYPLPAPISVGSVFNVCLGSSVTVSDATPGGTWSSSNTSVATIGSLSGVVTGISLGFSNITYMLPTGCYVTTPVFVQPNPAAITGVTNVCVGSTTSLTSGTSGGTWSSSAPTIADVGSSSGIVTGMSAGTATITYMLSTGCFATTIVTVDPLPDRISSGSVLTVCVGGTLTATSTTPGGTWSSNNTGIATIGITSGVITGISPGVAIITYMLPTGCYVTSPVIVTSGLSPITGTTSICVGSVTTLSNSTPGGTWSSSNTTVATVTGTGIVSGLSVGTTTITYSASGCIATTIVTANPLPAPIMGPNIVCVGNTIVLTNATPGGTWSSSNTAMATVGSLTGVVTGISVGGVTITYTLPTGCAVTYLVKVVPSPTPITGGSTSNICVGNTMTLSNGTPGGTWTSGNTTVATVGSGSGVVTGVSAGSATITYTVSVGCFVTTTVNIIALPTPIAGVLSVCIGTTSMLSSAPPGGAWSSLNPTVATITGTGLVTGISLGTSVITYTAPSGCYVVATVTVNPFPAPITGPSLVCVGSTITLSDATPGGVWSSSSTANATVGSSTGVVTGVGPFFVTITYTLPTGCYVTKSLKVDVLPMAITGITSVCVGNTTVLSDATPGGTWSSSNISVATVTIAGGVVTGISPGTATITYTLPTGCYATIAVTVNPNPAAITGPTFACIGNTITLASATPGGTWSSSTPAVATVGSSTGVVTGITVGFTTITYMLPGGCYVTHTIKVNPQPAPITGTATMCVGFGTILSDATPGGTWSSGNTPIATVSGTGVVSSVSVGTAMITYMLSSGCYSTVVVTVNPQPFPITGPTNVCVGLTITLANATPGGTWSSSSPLIATVGSTSGVVTGLAPGLVNITYMLPTGCFAKVAVTVTPAPCNVGVGAMAVGNYPVEVYPNPAYDELTIKAEAGIYSGYIITNQLGQVVLRNTITAEQTRVNVKTLPSGMYHISLKGDGVSKMMKFIKQ